MEAIGYHQLMNAQTLPLWQSNCRIVSSPNRDARPEGLPIDLIVIHSISLPPGVYGGEGIEQLFTNRLNAEAHPYYAHIAGLKVSSHFLIRRDGELVQFVPVSERAWHAGVSNWQERDRCNDFSIGVELEGDDDTPFAAAQYERLQALLLSLVTSYPVRAITSHSHIAPGRKTDPGSCFDWEKVQKTCPQLEIVP